MELRLSFGDSNPSWAYSPVYQFLTAKLDFKTMTFVSRLARYNLSVQRLSVCIPLTVYLVFIFMLNFTAVPLRSSNKKSLEQFFKSAVVQNKDKSVMLSVNVVDKDSLVRNFNSEDRKNVPPTELLASIFFK